MSQNIKGWTYRIFSDDLAGDTFGPFGSIVDLWRKKAGSGEARKRYPEWRDFELEDLAEWWGRLSLVDVRNDPFDIEFALWGTQLTEWWGIDYTRKKMTETYENRRVNWKKYEGPYFSHLTGNGGIGMVSGDLRALGRGFMIVQGIDLPLLKDGRVRQVLSAYRLPDENEEPVTKAQPVWQI